MFYGVLLQLKFYTNQGVELPTPFKFGRSFLHLLLRVKYLCKQVVQNVARRHFGRNRILGVTTIRWEFFLYSTITSGEIVRSGWLGKKLLNIFFSMFEVQNLTISKLKLLLTTCRENARTFKTICLKCHCSCFRCY